MQYKLGLVSVSFRSYSPKEILEEMRKCKLDLIEWGSDIHCPPEKAEEISRLTKQYAVKCCSYGTYFRLSVTPIEMLQSYINAAKTLGTRILRLWCGDRNSEDYTRGQKEALFAQCRDAAQIAERNDVVLCMECHDGTFTNKKEAAYELMRTVDSRNFRMYWQPDSYKTEHENIEYARLLSHDTEHLHVFHWKGAEKYPLREATDIWKEYLKCFDENRTLLLEFMPDDKLETLNQEVQALKEIVRKIG